MKSITTALIAISLGVSLATPSFAGDSGWVSYRNVKSISRTARAKSEIPVSVKCRNGSANKAALKLEIRVTTKPNSQKRNWALFTADLDYRPGASPAEWSNWKKVSGGVVKAPGSGKAVQCSLYHHKSTGTVSDGSPPISAKTSSGFRTLR